jgi:hypothetical protein
MQEAGLRRGYVARHWGLDVAELREETKLRLEHAGQVERLQRRVLLDALGEAGEDVGTPVSRLDYSPPGGPHSIDSSHDVSFVASPLCEFVSHVLVLSFVPQTTSASGFRQGPSVA